MERAKIIDLMLKDLLDSVAHYYGDEGLAKVVNRMKGLNRAREHGADIDALEAVLTDAFT
jgi:hypothetical protein